MAAWLGGTFKEYIIPTIRCAGKLFERTFCFVFQIVAEAQLKSERSVLSWVLEGLSHSKTSFEVAPCVHFSGPCEKGTPCVILTGKHDHHDTSLC